VQFRIVSESTFEGRNLVAPVPVVRLVLDFAELADRSPARLGPIFTACLEEFLSVLEANGGGGEDSPNYSAPDFRDDETFRIGHVVAAIALALQRAAGAEVSYAAFDGGADGTPGHQEIAYEHRGGEFGAGAGRIAIVAVIELLKNLNTSEDAEPLVQVSADYARQLVSAIRARWLDMTTAALVREAVKRGIPWRRVSPEARFVQLGQGCHQKIIHESVIHRTPSDSAWMSRNKAVTNRLLAEVGLPVARQSTIKKQNDIDEVAKSAVKLAGTIGFPVVVKPLNGQEGLGVSANLKDAAAVQKAVASVANIEDALVVESHVPGDDHRLLVVDGKLIAAAKRIPGHVVGNGTSSISELVAQVNLDPRRGVGFEKLLVRLELDAQAKRTLTMQGLDAAGVPAAGQVAYLRTTANISTGGTAVDVTDTIHPDNANAAVRAAATLGLAVAGVDMQSLDIRQSYRDNGAVILEVNSSPALRPHWLSNESRDVIEPILDAVYPPRVPYRVPIAAITGTNGKTTTKRMVARILEHGGHTVGFTTTDGAYVNRQRIVEGDVAVLETARHGIITSGLGFDWCDVGAVLNVDDDHIGTDGVRDIEELARIKSLVAQAARKLLVLNADD
jgi:cyanophycin synthetase